MSVKEDKGDVVLATEGDVSTTTRWNTLVIKVIE